MTVLLVMGILCFLLMEGFFSGSETGMISLNRLRLDRHAALRQALLRFLDGFV